MLPINTLLQDRYRIVREIGRGGMGAVYEAQHEQLKSLVAVKQTLVPDDLSFKALKHEAQLLANLRHPALPKVIDHFAEGDSQFMVMEFIPGKDLTELLRHRRQAFPYTQVVEWGIQLLDVLEYLHTHEPPIIHRDIKPNNLKLTAEGELILLDFGLSKGLAFSSNLSLYGYSLSYAPPEQVQGRGTDPRSDLYSTGATLYHLMTNTLPPDALVRAVNVAIGQPDLLRWASEVNPEVPREVAAILHSAMAINREQRPVSAAVMRQVLQNVTGLAARPMTRTQMPAYPATPVPQAPTGEFRPRNTNYATIPEPQNEPNWIINEPGRQNFQTANQTPQGNLENQPVETDVPLPFSVAVGNDQLPIPEGELDHYSGSKNTLSSLPENHGTAQTGRRLWLLGGALAVVVLAAVSLILFFILNDRKSAATAEVTSPPSTADATTSPSVTPNTDSHPATANVAKDADPSPKPSTATPASAEANEKKKRDEKPTSSIANNNTSTANVNKDANSLPSPPADPPAPAETTQKEEKEDKPAPPPVKEEKPEPAKPEPATPPSSSVIQSQVISGKATRRVNPMYPPMARAAKVTGIVIVEVTVDEKGKVIAAHAISGHPLLKEAAVAAARGWKFIPTQLNGQAVKVTSTITFNFQL